MDHKYENIIKKISGDEHIPIQRVYNLCDRLGLVKKVELPKLHWEVTKSGRQFLVIDNYEALIEKIEDAEADLERGPNLGKPGKHITKICGCCNKKMDIDFFGESRKTEDGYTKWCTSCSSKLRR